jgi:hypothetical protein
LTIAVDEDADAVEPSAVHAALTGTVGAGGGELGDAGEPPPHAASSNSTAQAPARKAIRMVSA